MTDLQSLEQQVQRHPGDRKLRLVYADALEEAGNLTKATEQRVLTHPRCYYRQGEFSNCYTIFVVPRPLVVRFEKAFPKAERISYRTAWWLGHARVREAVRDNEQWFGGFAQDGGDANQLSLPLDARLMRACQATINEIEYQEMVREAGTGW